MRNAMAEAKPILAVNLRRLRNSKGMTQQQLATAAGMTVSNIVQIEKGKITNPRINTVQALARVLDCTMEELMAEPADQADEKEG